MANGSDSTAKQAPHSYLGNIEEVRQVFNQYDKNRDGKISCDELREVLSALGSCPCTLDEAKRVMSEIDKDGDGSIDMDEFTEMVLGGSECGNKNFKDAFDLYDLDKNGLISARELHEVMKKLGQNWSLKDCRKMIVSVDKDGDGNVNFEEFKMMMSRSSDQ